MEDKKSIQDYKDYYSSVCRTCLQSNGEMQSLSAPMHGGANKYSYLDCLNYCMPSYSGPTADGLSSDALPTQICKDCASALQVAYWFMKNASKAQEVLKIRINELKEKQKQIERQEAAQAKANEEVKKPKRYRCKICNTKLETKRSLKDHVKLHLDIIAYNCHLCGFEHHQRNHLIQHYQLTHGVDPTPEQVKPKTKITPPNKSSSSTTVTRQADNLNNNEQRQQYPPQQQPQLLSNSGEVYVENHLPATATTQNSHEIIYTSAPQNQNIIYATAINTQTTPLEGNAATIFTTQPNGNATAAFTFNPTTFEGNLNNAQNDTNVGNEYIVMADTSVENVMGKGVVIEYINAGDGTALSLDNGLVLENILQVQNDAGDTQNIIVSQNNGNTGNIPVAQIDGGSTTNMIISQNDMVQMDVDDLIVEDPENTPEQTQDVPISPIDEDMIPATFIEQPKRNICKICAKEFDTQDALKNHMLTHNEIPHFFCDHCSFYTFFKIDLNQHYKSKHNIQPTNKQLQPKNKPTTRCSETEMDPQTKNAIVQKIERFARSPKLVYSCDICFYECDLKYEIKRHYLAKHRMNVHDIQQRPTRTGITNNTSIIQPITPVTSVASTSATTSTASSISGSPPKLTNINLNNNMTTTQAEEDAMLPDYLNGLNCRKCNEVFFYRNKLYEHYKLHSAQEEATRLQKQANKMQKSVNNTQGIQQLEMTQQLQEQPNANSMNLQQNETHLQLQQQNINTEPQLQYQESNLNQTQQPHLQQVLQQLPQQEVVITTTPLDNSLTSTFNNVVDPMTLVLTPNTSLNNTAAPLTPSSSSTYTLPSDAIPQIVEMEQTIETDMDFDFNGDALFEDFDDVENSSDDNDMRNLALTSDDDFDDVLKEQSESQTETATSYCAQCQKSFLSQYQFENHMFLHRGLAPYRCEMCTNLYNTKRALIRHYRAVHKKYPTRDMIQAKGDKVYVCDKTTTDYMSIEKSTVTTFMCAKCTYESTDFPSAQLHLNTNHSIHDDSYILKKTATTTTTTTTAPVLNENNIINNGNNNNLDTMQQVMNNTAATSGLEGECGAEPAQLFDISGTGQSDDGKSINDGLSFEQCVVTPSTSTSFVMICPDLQGELTLDTVPTTANNTDLTNNKELMFDNADMLTTNTEITTNSLPTTTLEDLTTTNEMTNSNNITMGNDETMSNYAPSNTQLEEANTLDPQTSLSPQTSLDPQTSVAANKVLYKCIACQEQCTTIESVRLHSRKVACRDVIKALNKDQKSSALYKCEVCDMKYPSLYLLRHHVKRHMARTFRCFCCPKSYLSKLDLDTHQRTHTNERPHQCDKCPNSFRYAHHLKRHKDIIHFGKRYMCPEANCNRQFTTMEQLKVHKWSHCGIVPVKCKECGQQFKKKLFLRNHCSKIHNKALTDDEEFNGNDLTCKSPQEDILQPINWD
ncbi:uncharacterized protein isoform X2 [Musca autumnalis]|uniref:uncharacterized protein isoform X2 n=1 Tax=Musca autumnalis TaxID=221902 RepID=UPI003CE69303